LPPDQQRDQEKEGRRHDEQRHRRQRIDNGFPKPAGAGAKTGTLPGWRAARIARLPEGEADAAR